MVPRKPFLRLVWEGQLKHQLILRVFLISKEALSMRDVCWRLRLWSWTLLELVALVQQCTVYFCPWAEVVRIVFGYTKTPRTKKVVKAVSAFHVCNAYFVCPVKGKVGVTLKVSTDEHCVTQTSADWNLEAIQRLSDDRGLKYMTKLVNYYKCGGIRAVEQPTARFKRFSRIDPFIGPSN